MECPNQRVSWGILRKQWPLHGSMVTTCILCRHQGPYTDPPSRKPTRCQALPSKGTETHVTSDRFRCYLPNQIRRPRTTKTFVSSTCAPSLPSQYGACAGGPWLNKHLRLTGLDSVQLGNHFRAPGPGAKWSGGLGGEPRCSQQLLFERHTTALNATIVRCHPGMFLVGQAG